MSVRANVCAHINTLVYVNFFPRVWIPQQNLKITIKWIFTLYPYKMFRTHTRTHTQRFAFNIAQKYINCRCVFLNQFSWDWFSISLSFFALKHRLPFHAILHWNRLDMMSSNKWMNGYMSEYDIDCVCAERVCDFSFYLPISYMIW